MAEAKHLEPAVRALRPVRLDRAGFTFAQGVEAGDWVFATGHLASDYQSGVAPEVLDRRRQLQGTGKQELEADLIFERLAAVLSEAGAGMDDIVRLDQFYTGWQTVPHYHVARHKAFAGTSGVPASTSIIQSGLVLPEADIHVDMVACRSRDGGAREVLRPDGLPVSWHMGYAPVARVGDFLFLSGQMAEHDNSGIAPEAKVPASHLWKGSAIRLETDYILRNKIIPALHAAGGSLRGVVKAQAYLSDMTDLPAFLNEWGKWFPEDPPALTVVPTARPGFNCPDASIEINVVALRDDASTVRQAVSERNVSPLSAHQASAVRAGDLLFISGLLACDAGNLTPDARRDRRQPFYGNTGRAQMNHMLDAAEALCTAAGTRLGNVVRIQQFHTDLSELPAAIDVWSARLPEAALPLAAVAVPGPLAVEDATIMVDLWVHVPADG